MIFVKFHGSLTDATFVISKTMDFKSISCADLSLLFYGKHRSSRRFHFGKS